MLVKTLKWPFIGTFISGSLHFGLVGIWPELRNYYTPPLLGLVQLVIGAWLGYVAVRNGGSFLTAILYGAVLGLFPLFVYPLSFGIILGEGLHATMLAGVFGWANFVIGSLVGGGFAVSLDDSRE